MPSSVIESYHYDQETRTLRINFLSGNIYHYLNVPENVFIQMKEAKSKGTFLNKVVKANYEFIKVMTPDM